MGGAVHARREGWGGSGPERMRAALQLVADSPARQGVDDGGAPLLDMLRGEDTSGRAAHRVYAMGIACRVMRSQAPKALSKALSSTSICMRSHSVRLDLASGTHVAAWGVTARATWHPAAPAPRHTWPARRQHAPGSACQKQPAHAACRRLRCCAAAGAAWLGGRGAPLDDARQYHEHLDGRVGAPPQPRQLLGVEQVAAVVVHEGRVAAEVRGRHGRERREPPRHLGHDVRLAGGQPSRQ